MKKKLLYATILVALCSCAHKGEQQILKEREILTLALQSINYSTSYSAAIQGQQDIMILPQVGGFITKLCVSEGQQVKKDQGQ